MLIVHVDNLNNRSVASLKGVDWVDGEIYLHLSTGKTLVCGPKSDECIIRIIPRDYCRSMYKFEFTVKHVENDVVLRGPDMQYTDYRQADMSWRRMYDIIERFYIDELAVKS